MLASWKEWRRLAGAMAEFVDVAVWEKQKETPEVTAMVAGVTTGKSFVDALKGGEGCTVGEHSVMKMIRIAMSFAVGDSGWSNVKTKMDLARRWVELRKHVDGKCSLKWENDEGGKDETSGGVLLGGQPPVEQVRQLLQKTQMLNSNQDLMVEITRHVEQLMLSP